MNIVYFTHSLASCWNHGNAHFLRGLLRELVERGHAVKALEPRDGWSRQNLTADHGEAPLDRFAKAFPELRCELYDEQPDLEAVLVGADVVIVHEWTVPAIVAALGALRNRSARFQLLFHDTHHRAVSDPAAIRALDLDGYDGILAFGQSLAEIYRRHGWSRRTFVLHEAADTQLFQPPEAENAASRAGVVWVGNWGDDERTSELVRFLLRPCREAGLSLDVYGVRYPSSARATLAEYGANYRGWLANLDVPSVLARHLATVHVPRRFYAARLPGIPTIRVFEALACGIPLVCAPWQDSEGLFRPGRDYLSARNEREMRDCLRAILAEPGLRRSLTASGLETIWSRHTCGHRAEELLRIVQTISSQSVRGAA